MLLPVFFMWMVKINKIEINENKLYITKKILSSISKLNKLKKYKKNYKKKYNKKHEEMPVPVCYM